MCAAEHGQVEIVKFLLAQPDTDIFAKDNDGLTALAVAMEAGHRDLGVILYANMSMSRGTSPYSSMRLRPSAGAGTAAGTGGGGSRTSTPSGDGRGGKSKGATPPRSPIAPTPPLRSRRTSSNQWISTFLLSSTFYIIWCLFFISASFCLLALHVRMKNSFYL